MKDEGKPRARLLYFISPLVLIWRAFGKKVEAVPVRLEMKFF